jgi:5-methylcytosine-specific restriction endonuclease McrA
MTDCAHQNTRAREAERRTNSEARRQWYEQRAGGICEGCRQESATEVHHLTYEHAGREFLWELVAICRRCHERYHEVRHA